MGPLKDLVKFSVSKLLLILVVLDNPEFVVPPFPVLIHYILFQFPLNVFGFGGKW